MKKMKKVEVIIESIYTNRVLELFKKNGVTGYTIIRDIEGCGSHGLKTADEANDLLSNNYIFTVCEEEKFEKMIEKIRSFIDRYGGKCIISTPLFYYMKKSKDNFGRLFLKIFNNHLYRSLLLCLFIFDSECTLFEVCI